MQITNQSCFTYIEVLNVKSVGAMTKGGRTTRLLKPRSCRIRNVYATLTSLLERGYCLKSL